MYYEVSQLWLIFHHILTISININQYLQESSSNSMHVTRNSGNGYGNIVLTDGAMADMEGSGTLMVRQYVDDVVRTSSPSQSSPTLGPASCMTHQHQHQRSGTHSSSGSGPGSCNSSFLGADSNFSAGTLHYLNRSYMRTYIHTRVRMHMKSKIYVLTYVSTWILPQHLLLLHLRRQS